MNPPGRLIQRIALISAVLGTLGAVAVGVYVSPKSGISSAVGTLVGVLNLWVLARLVVGMLDDKRTNGRRARAAILLSVKGVALVTVVGILVVRHIVNGGAFMAGMSIVAASIVVGGLFSGTPEPSAPAEPTEPRTDA